MSSRNWQKMITKDINLWQFSNKTVSLDCYYLLELVNQKKDITLLTGKVWEDIKILQDLTWIDENYHITLLGKEELENIYKKDKNLRIKKKEIEYSDEYNIFWQLFPATDNFTINGSFFTGTRSFKVNKEGCFKKYNECIKKYSPEKILNALKVQVNLFKTESHKRNENRMRYFLNSYTWFNKEAYLPYLDMKIEEKTAKTKSEIII